MNVVVDRPSILLLPGFQEEMLLNTLLVSHVLEMEWNGLRNSEQIELRGLKTTKRICFVSGVMYDSVLSLKEWYPGFSIPGLMILQFCLQTGYPLYTTDDNLLTAARELGVKEYDLDEIVVRNPLAKDKLKRKTIGIKKSGGL